jgi:hypothetical protein
MEPFNNKDYAEHLEEDVAYMFRRVGRNLIGSATAELESARNNVNISDSIKYRQWAISWIAAAEEVSDFATKLTAAPSIELDDSRLALIQLGESTVSHLDKLMQQKTTSNELNDLAKILLENYRAVEGILAPYVKPAESAPAV